MINCKDCRYWVDSGKAAGECHFNPPAYNEDCNIGNWPYSYPEDCCAQGQPKEGGWSSKEDDPRFRILKDMPNSPEENKIKIPYGFYQNVAPSKYEDDKNRRLSRLAESMRETNEVLRKELDKGATKDRLHTYKEVESLVEKYFDEKATEKINKMQRVVDAAVNFQRFQDEATEKEIEKGTFTREQLDDVGEHPVFTELKDSIKEYEWVK